MCFQLLARNDLLPHIKIYISIKLYIDLPSTIMYINIHLHWISSPSSFPFGEVLWSSSQFSCVSQPRYKRFPTILRFGHLHCSVSMRDNLWIVPAWRQTLGEPTACFLSLWKLSVYYFSLLPVFSWLQSHKRTQAHNHWLLRLRKQSPPILLKIKMLITTFMANSPDHQTHGLWFRVLGSMYTVHVAKGGIPKSEARGK